MTPATRLVSLAPTALAAAVVLSCAGGASAQALAVDARWGGAAPLDVRAAHVS